MLATQGRIDMEVESYSNVKNNLKFFMKKVKKEHKPIIITSKNNEENSVLMSKDEYDNLIENTYIRCSQANVKHIMKSWSQLKNAGVKKRRKN